MGLVLAYELTSGLTAEYYRIISIEIDSTLDSSKCCVALYKDLAARTAEKAPVVNYVFTFTGDDNPCTVVAMDAENSNPIKLMYNKLKTLPTFTNAVDAL